MAGLELAALGLPSPSSGVPPLDLALSVLCATSLDLLFTTHPATLPAGAPSPLLGPSLASPATWAGVWALSARPGSALQAYTQATAPLLGVWESLDPLLLLFELALLVLVISWVVSFTSLGFLLQRGYGDLVTFCQHRSISLVETFGLLSLFLGFILFDAFVTLAEDDTLEAAGWVFAAVIASAVTFLALAVDVQFYYLVCSVSGAEPALRLLYADFVNNVLCLLRVFLCWLRYVFYDLQAELLDLSFHFTELGGVDATLGGVLGLGYLGGEVGSPALGALLGLLCTLATLLLEAAFVIAQLLLGGVKLGLALFLFWLILDLFLLRVAVRTEARWAALGRAR